MMRCESCGFLVESPHVCQKTDRADSAGIEVERACVRVSSPLTGREYVACFVSRAWHGLKTESAAMAGETIG